MGNAVNFLKTVEARVSGGSNPSLRAKKDRVEPVSSARPFHFLYYAISPEILPFVFAIVA